MKKKYLSKCCVSHSIWRMFLTLKLTAFFMLGSVLLTYAQQATISGKITDSDGQALPGVTVIVKGNPTLGTVSNIDGNYTLPNVPSNGTLQFSFVGMVPQEVALNGRTAVNVSLAQDAIGLDEVIAIGYGTQRKRDVTSAITIVSADDMAKVPTSNVATALQGLAPGIMVSTNQGRPGSMGSVTIRGTSSISGNTEPLYVIDGIPYDDASTVNPADIASMQVLKDAASSAIYGSRGANGVILITTKSGSSGNVMTGEPNVRYSGYYGFEEAWNLIDMMSTAEWAQTVYEANAAAGQAPPALARYIMENKNGQYTEKETNWLEEVFQTGIITENNIDVSGRTNSGNYFFSAGHYYQDGIIINTPYERYSVRMNSNWKKGNFSFGENISFNISQNENEDAFEGRAALQESLKITPNIPVYDPNNTVGGFAGSNYQAPGYPYNVGHDAHNPVAAQVRQKNMSYGRRLAANAYGEYKVIEDLTLRTTFGFNNYDSQSRNLTLRTIMPPKSHQNTTLDERANWRFNWVWENMATYRKVFGDHDINVMGAYTVEYMKAHGFGGSGQGLQTDVNDILPMMEGNYGVSGSESIQSRISYLGRVMYNLKGKYMLTANIRYDGSSKFGPGNKWGTFPSASLAWRLSDEPFMDSFSNWMSNLKLRGSYGVVGNDRPINAYAYLQGLSGQDYNYNGSILVGQTLTGFSNPDLTWETSKQTGIGADIGLFNGALEITADWYNNKTIDMLVGIPLPGSSGSTGSIQRNVGSILNRGWEFQAIYRKNKGDFQYTLSGNISTNYNEVLDLYGVVINAGNVGDFGGNVTRTEIGHAIGQFYGYKTDGIFKSQAEIDAYVKDGKKIQPDAKPGDVKFVDIDNNGSINSSDRDYIGDPAPKFMYGLNASFAYKGFDLSLFFQGVYGNDVFAALVGWTQGMHNNFNSSPDALDRWTPTNTNTDVPRAIRNDPNGNIRQASDRFIKDGSYLRLKNTTLGYTIPKAWANYIKISNLRVYATGRNLLTFTKYPFFDPEIGATGSGSSATNRAIDNGYYPQARTIIMGIQLDF